LLSLNRKPAPERQARIVIAQTIYFQGLFQSQPYKLGFVEACKPKDDPFLGVPDILLFIVVKKAQGGLVSDYTCLYWQAAWFAANV
jgi:hypothetical protein